MTKPLKISNIDLSKFEECPEEYPSVKLLITVKSFDLNAIRHRYLESRKRSKTGSVSRREPAEGGLVQLDINKGAIAAEKILARLPEPRGLDICNHSMAVSSANRIYIFSLAHEKVQTIDDPWLSYIHTVKFDNNGSKLLVTSSGFDLIKEYNLSDENCSWEWLAWEHGIADGVDPSTGECFLLTRDPLVARQLEKGTARYKLVSDPLNETLPTALRAAFINTAEYGSDDSILATLFHSGKVISINRITGDWKPLIEGLTRPHGGMKYEDGVLVTDTAGGKVVVKNGGIISYYFFSDFPGKADNMKDLEWLQTSQILDNIIVTVDSNRNRLTFFNPENKTMMNIYFNPDWAIQDIRVIDDNSSGLLNRLTEYFS